MIKKKVSPKGNSVSITFSLPADAASRSVAVVGDFNDWDATKGQMKLNAKKTLWSKRVSVKPDTTVQFRYFVDGEYWLNDEAADAVVPNEFFSENCVIEL